MFQVMNTVVYEPGDLVTWQGWDSIVVDVDFERQYQYRLEIQEITGQNFRVLAKEADVKYRSPGSKRYTSTLCAAICAVEEEDRRQHEASKCEQDYGTTLLRAALVQAESELRWMQSWFWWALGLVSLVSFILGYVTRR